MFANALLLTIAVMLAIGFTLMGELRFFIPFKVVIWRTYSAYVLSYCGLLFTNVFAARHSHSTASSSSRTRPEAGPPRYRLYHKASRQIEPDGGKVRRVALDYELKKRINKALARLGPDKQGPNKKNEIAQAHSVLGYTKIACSVPKPDRNC